MAGSGSKRVLWNTREKVLSTDLNRAQSFIAALRNDWLRYWVNASKQLDEYGGGLIEAPVDSVGAPLQADVFGGLTVIPQQGKTSVHVLPGVVGMLDPDSTPPPDPDDSPYKLIVDPGVTGDGVLTVTANASGSIRIDVIECQRAETVLENDNRDIYNTATGLFSALPVDKAFQGLLGYRVRAGTPGAGYPGSASGWLPLAVVSVPNGATSTDDATFWDVRPLVSDRPYGPGRVASDFPADFGQLDLGMPGSNSRLAGYARGEQSLGATGGVYRVGGILRKGTPGGDVAYVDLTDVENQETGFSVASQDIYYVWLLFPEGLPRWVRYIETPVGGERYPFGPRGIPIVSTIAPLATTLAPTTAIQLPVVTGLTSTVGVGRCIYAAAADTVPAPGSSFCTKGDVNLGWPITAVAPAGVTTAVKDEYQLDAGTHFPQNAKSVRVRIRCIINGSSTNVFSYGTEILVTETLGGATIAQAGQGGNLTVQTQQLLASSGAVEFEAVIPRWPPWANQGASPSDKIFFTVFWNIGGTFTTKTNAQLDVVGWQL